jgi:predicted nucleic acid-binding protein
MDIYLDVCCLNRLFDDQRQFRVSLEATAIERILQLVESRKLTDYSSEMAIVEIERIASFDRRRKVSALLPPAKRIMALTGPLLDAAEKFQQIGFGVADAVHLAAAGHLGVAVFLSVDDRLLRRAKRLEGRLAFRVLNPVAFIQEFDNAVNG